MTENVPQDEKGEASDMLNQPFFQRRRKAWRAVYLLIDRESVQMIAEKLRVNRRTVSRWKKHPVFIEFWRRTEAEMYDGMNSSRSDRKTQHASP